MTRRIPILLRLTKPKRPSFTGHLPLAKARNERPFALTLRRGLRGNKTPLRGVVWKCSRKAYAWGNYAARVPGRRGLAALAGGVSKFMGSGEQTSRYGEMRRAPRYVFRADLEIEWGSALLRGSTRDISSNGMFIESTDPLWVGAGFTAHLALDRPVKLDCFVKRIEPGRGMGVTVTLREEQHEKRYQDLLAALSQQGI